MPMNNEVNKKEELVRFNKKNLHNTYFKFFKNQISL